MLEYFTYKIIISISFIAGMLTTFLLFWFAWLIEYQYPRLQLKRYLYSKKYGNPEYTRDIRIYLDNDTEKCKELFKKTQLLFFKKSHDAMTKIQYYLKRYET